MTNTWVPARGEQGGQTPTLEKITVGMVHPENFSRGLKTGLNVMNLMVVNVVYFCDA